MTETLTEITFEEFVRKRPFFFIGNNGIIDLFAGLIIDCISLCGTDAITFEITVVADNDFVLAIESQQNLSNFWQRFSSGNDGFNNCFPAVLKIVSSKFNIEVIDQWKSNIHFSLDGAIIKNTDIDYLTLSEKILKVALLNRKSEIITVDKRRKYIDQNYCHFPQGIFYLFNKAVSEALGKPEFKLAIDCEVNNNFYQIGLAYRTDWFPTPRIISFANDVHTVCGGSLVEGVLDGLVNACKAYAKENNLINIKVKRKKCINGLILVCAVRGQDFGYGGSWKETLEDEVVKKEASALVTKLALEFFMNDKQKADSFLWRFDDTQLGAKIM